MNVLLSTLLFIILRVSSVASIYHYILLPYHIDAHVTGVHSFHIYLTASGDTEATVDLPTTYLSLAVQLNQHNDWVWEKEIIITSDLITAATTTGIHVTSDGRLNILTTKNATTTHSLTAYTVFELEDEPEQEYIIITSSSISRNYKPSLVVATGQNISVVSTYAAGSTAPILNAASRPGYSVYKYETTHPTNVIGYRVVTSGSTAVFGGIPRTYMPITVFSYVSMFYQIPNTKKLGTVHIVGPFDGKLTADSFSVMVVVIDPDTIVTVVHNLQPASVSIPRSSLSTCSCDDTVPENCTVMCNNAATVGSYIEVLIADVTKPVMVICTKPCLLSSVIHSVSKGSYFKLGGSMSLVAPPRVVSETHFFVPYVESLTETQQTWVNIAVPTVDVDGLVIDGVSLGKLRKFSRCEKRVIGRWTVVTVYMLPGNHRIKHQQADVVPLAVHVYGVVYQHYASVTYPSTFGYPAIFLGPTDLAEEPGTPTDTDSGISQTSSRPQITSQPTENDISSQVVDPLPLVMYTLLGVILAANVVHIVMATLNYRQISKLSYPKLQINENRINTTPSTMATDLSPITMGLPKPPDADVINIRDENKRGRHPEDIELTVGQSYENLKQPEQDTPQVYDEVY